MNSPLQHGLKISRERGISEQYKQDIGDAATAHSKELGFLPYPVAYDDAIHKNNIIVAETDGGFAGFLLFSYSRSTIRAVQTYAKLKRQGVGTAMVKYLIEYGNSHAAEKIRARVGADLGASRFWETLGFKLVDVEPPKKPGGRAIKVYEYRLDGAAQMFPTGGLGTTLSSIKPVASPNSPTIRSLRYAVDMNVLIDILDRRAGEGDARNILKRAMSSSLFGIYITKEFVKEMERNGKSPGDDIVRKANEFSILEEISSAATDELIRNLQKIVYPNRSKLSSQDESDLRHLAICIQHQLTGFITRDRKLLEASDQIYREHGLRIMSPHEFSEPLGQEADVAISVGQTHLKIRQPTTQDAINVRGLVEKRVVGLGMPVHEIDDVMLKRSEIAVADDQIVGFALTLQAESDGTDVEVLLWVDEASEVFLNVANALLGFALSLGKSDCAEIYITLLGSMDETRRVARDLGFLAIATAPARLRKVRFNQTMTLDEWDSMVEDVSQTGIILHAEPPTPKKISTAGIGFEIKESGGYQFNLFDFETLLSPVKILHRGRRGYLISIKEEFASLLGSEREAELFHTSAASRYSEKAYYATSNKYKQIGPGDLVVFYVSNSDGSKKLKGRQAAIGIGRVTSCGLYSRQDAIAQFRPQGVYGDDEIPDKVYVMTFDNFVEFDKPIKFKRLKEKGWMSGAHAVAPEELSYSQLKEIAKEGYDD